jgi:hypothetical protein
MGSYIAPSVGTYGMGMPMTAPMTTSMAMPTMAAPVHGGSITASVPGSISAPAMSLPASNMFSGYTATPFLPAAGYNPATFGGPIATSSGLPLPTPLANSVASLPMSTGYGGYGTTYGAATYAPTTYAPRTYGTTYGAPAYGTTYGAPSYGTTYGATTTYAAPAAPGTPTPA